METRASKQAFFSAMHRSIDKVHRNSEELAIRVFRDTKEIFRAGKRMNQANLIVARIERARQDRGISVAELARRINVDRKRLWYVLNGQRSMHVDEFVRLCAVMDMSLACFLTKEQASDLAEHYGWARMAQVVGNFFGGSLSVGIDRYRNLGDQGDNGVYVIDGWKIVDRYATAYDEDWNAVGLRLIDPSAEQREYDFDEMLHAFDEAMPEKLRLGLFLDAQEITVSDVRLGDKVWVSAYESNPELFEVVGFGADDAPRGFKGVPFVNRYEHDGDYSWNGNNYIDADTCRIAPRV